MSINKNSDFEELLNKGDRDSLEECKHWLLLEERRISIERDRLEYEANLFDKKMSILKSGFADLENDRKKLERERKAFEADKNSSRSLHVEEAYEDIAGSFFSGVNNYLALKKRYRDLLKIFHPDNMCGDSDMVVLLTREYERIKSEMEYNIKYK